MEACAWVLERNGRLPGRDAWAVPGGKMPVGRWAGVLAVPRFSGRDKTARLAGLRREAIANQLLASVGTCGCRWIRPTCGDVTCWSNRS